MVTFKELCVNSTKRRYSENQYREITTANWGLATTNQPIFQGWRGPTFSRGVQLFPGGGGGPIVYSL